MLQSTFSKVALWAAGGAVAAMTAAGPAMAVAPTAPDVSAGTVLAPEKGGGKVHKGYTTKKTRVYHRPHRNSGTRHWIPANKVIHLKCKVRGQMGPNSLWYKLAKHRGWVNSRTVIALTHVPYCRHHHSMENESFQPGQDTESYQPGQESESYQPGQDTESYQPAQESETFQPAAEPQGALG